MEAFPIFSRLHDRWGNTGTVYRETWEKHVKAVWAVLQELRQAGLMARPMKCALGQSETKYLGFLVGQGQITPLKDKVVVIQNYEVPQNKKKISVFWGLANDYR